MKFLFSSALAMLMLVAPPAIALDPPPLPAATSLPVPVSESMPEHPLRVPESGSVTLPIPSSPVLVEPKRDPSYDEEMSEACVKQGGIWRDATQGFVSYCESKTLQKNQRACTAKNGVLQWNGLDLRVECVVPVYVTDCEKYGGKWERIFQSTKQQMEKNCVYRFKDGGKTCRDGSECQSGTCYIFDKKPWNADQVGECAKTNQHEDCKNNTGSLTKGENLGSECPPLAKGYRLPL